MEELERRLACGERQLADALIRIVELEIRIRAMEQQDRESRGGG